MKKVQKILENTHVPGRAQLTDDHQFLLLKERIVHPYSKNGGDDSCFSRTPLSGIAIPAILRGDGQEKPQAADARHHDTSPEPPGVYCRAALPEIIGEYIRIGTLHDPLQPGPGHDTTALFVMGEIPGMPAGPAPLYRSPGPAERCPMMFLFYIFDAILDPLRKYLRTASG